MRWMIWCMAMSIYRLARVFNPEDESVELVHRVNAAWRMEDK